MRLVALVLTAIFAVGSATAGQSAASSSGAAASPESAAKSGQKDAPSSGLPVSLDKIREGLEKTPPAPVIRGLNEQSAHFQVQIQERQKIEELLATLDFRTGPKGAPRYPGGWTQYEQDRLTNHPIDSPLTQPFAAFSTSELLTIAIENLTAKYLGGRLLDAVSNAERARAERAAREEVAKAMADFCGSQPNQGTGLQVCAVNATER
jgi:hypothetical protein